MFTGLWCVFPVVDRCFAYQETTSKRTVDAADPQSAYETQGCQVQDSEESQPHPGRVSTGQTGPPPQWNHGLQG